MGLSASQGRMLSLTSRLSDLEYQAQNISNQKVRLADRSETASKDYLDALGAKKLTAYNAETRSQVDATVNSLYSLNDSSANGTKRYLVNQSGQIVGPANTSIDSTTATALKSAKFSVNSATASDGSITYSADSSSNTNNNFDSTEWLYEQLNMGNLFIVEYNKEGGTEGTGAWEEISWSSGDSQLQTKNDEYELASAEAKYETAMSEIQSKDKRFDLELKTIDTEHSAIQQEIESVGKVMDKNIERTFKIFS